MAYTQQIMKKYLSILMLALALSACKKDSLLLSEGPDAPLADITDISQMKAPAGFNYETSNDVEFFVKLLSNDDAPLAGVRVDIMDKTPEEGGKIYFTGSTNAQGILLVKREMPIGVTQVVINTDYIGLPNNILMDIETGIGKVTIGGKNPERLNNNGDRLPIANAPLGKNSNKYSFRLGTFSLGLNAGVPNYLMPTNDVITPTFLADINATLPERQSVPVNKPQYLASNAEKNLVLTEQCDIWITFVHEGAGQRNTLFYFVYNKNNKPTSLSQVDSFITILPNASFLNSGGGLSAGNKVFIGRFGADTAIGFAIAANGWNGTGSIASTPFFTSISSMNPETNPAFRDHVVLLHDNPTQRFLIGFEDVNRNPTGTSDNDFNDLIIYATANPTKAIQTTTIPPVTPAADADGDGINDTYDEYPNDAARAFNVYYPSATTVASVAFEDLWPSQGDYDLNDVVVDFQYHAVTNASNQIKDLNAKYLLRAAGGVFKNGFSVILPFDRTNATMNAGSTVVGLESAANEAILKVFNNSKALIPTFNTMLGETYIGTDTLYARMTLTNPVSSSLGVFNPFIYIDEAGKGRGNEVHLPGKAPSSLVNNNVLGTDADATNPSAGVYYKTANGFPFAIATPERFDYPLEKEQIIHAHLKFAQWVQSGGVQFQDWYKSESGYRNAAKFYTAP